MISQEAHPDANVIWGVAFDPELEDEMKITIIATGFEKKPEDAARTGKDYKTNANRPSDLKPAAKESVFVKSAPAATAAPAAQPATVRRVVKPTPKPVKEDDDFDGLLDMFKKN